MYVACVGNTLVPRNRSAPKAVVVKKVVADGSLAVLDFHVRVEEGLEFIVVQYNDARNAMTTRCLKRACKKSRKFLFVDRMSLRINIKFSQQLAFKTVLVAKPIKERGKREGEWISRSVNERNEVWSWKLH